MNRSRIGSQLGVEVGVGVEKVVRPESESGVGIELFSKLVILFGRYIIRICYIEHTITRLMMTYESRNKKIITL